MSEARPKELKALSVRACQELGVTVPVARYEKHGRGGLKLWLTNGHGVVTWAPKPKADARRKRVARKKAVKDEV